MVDLYANTRIDLGSILLKKKSRLQKYNIEYDLIHIDRT